MLDITEKMNVPTLESHCFLKSWKFYHKPIDDFDTSGEVLLQTPQSIGWEVNQFFSAAPAVTVVSVWPHPCSCISQFPDLGRKLPFQNTEKSCMDAEARAESLISLVTAFFRLWNVWIQKKWTGLFWKSNPPLLLQRAWRSLFQSVV